MDFFTNDSAYRTGDDDADLVLDCIDPLFSRSIDLVLCVLYFLLAVVGTAGNIMVCISVYITPNLHTAWNYLLVNLSIADMIGTGIYFPFLATDLIQRSLGVCIAEAQHTTSDVVVNVSFTASLLTITLVGIERAVVIIWPFKYARVLSTSVFRVSLAGIWFVAVAFGVGGGMLQWPHFTSYLSIPMYAVMLACYTAIFVAIKRRKTDITRHTRRETVERRVVKTILTVTVVFTLFWTPMFGFLFSGLMEEWEDIAFPVAASSAVFNPFVYCYKNSEYRKAFKRIISCPCNDKKPSPGPPVSIISLSRKRSETGENNS